MPTAACRRTGWRATSRPWRAEPTRSPAASRSTNPRPRACRTRSMPAAGWRVPTRRCSSPSNRGSTRSRTIPGRGTRPAPGPASRSGSPPTARPAACRPCPSARTGPSWPPSCGRMPGCATPPTSSSSPPAGSTAAPRRGCRHDAPALRGAGGPVRPAPRTPGLCPVPVRLGAPVAAPPRDRAPRAHRALGALAARAARGCAPHRRPLHPRGGPGSHRGGEPAPRRPPVASARAAPQIRAARLVLAGLRCGAPALRRLAALRPNAASPSPARSGPVLGRASEEAGNA